MIVKKAHFIGIGGVGMSATAKLLKDSGIMVSGSDEDVYPPVSTLLHKEGLAWQSPYRAENIPNDADLLIIGKNAKLVPETNAEVAAAYTSGKKILSFPEVLAELAKGKEAVVVAGSYGKSTSTALLAHVLLAAGKDPSYFIGAVPHSPAHNAALGAGGLFIMEGDEYPASNTDPRSKFLLMGAAQTLITPLAHDHINTFPTPVQYLAPFYQLVDGLPPSSTPVVCTEGPLSKEFLSHLLRPRVTYGVAEGEYRATNITWGERTRFVITHNSHPIVEVETSQLGKHNVQNIVGVAALLLNLGLVTTDQFATAVSSFKGLVRRLDRKSERTSIPIFEGFGSSWEKLRSAIAAMKLHFPNKRLVVVFEPNTIVWRRRESLPRYDNAFAGAEKVYLFNPPHDGKETQLTTEEIAERVRAAGTEAMPADGAEQILKALARDLQPGDCILLSSSGALGGLVESVPALAERRFPA